MHINWDRTVIALYNLYSKKVCTDCASWVSGYNSTYPLTHCLLHVITVEEQKHNPYIRHAAGQMQASSAIPYKSNVLSWPSTLPADRMVRSALLALMNGGKGGGGVDCKGAGLDQLELLAPNCPARRGSYCIDYRPTGYRCIILGPTGSIMNKWCDDD